MLTHPPLMTRAEKRSHDFTLGLLQGRAEGAEERAALVRQIDKLERDLDKARCVIGAWSAPWYRLAVVEIRGAAERWFYAAVGCVARWRRG